ncbi:MAG: PAS domain S-box protein [Flavobacteriales bacterium]|nr:PAS domain S-box protein [Flavobacteriales bacterium]
MPLNSGFKSQVFENLFQHLPGFFFRSTTEANWPFLYFTGKVNELLDESGVTLIQKNTGFLDIIHPLDINDFHKAYKDTIALRGNFNFRFRLKSNTGKITWVRTHTCPVYSDKGEVLFLEGYIQEISDYDNESKTVFNTAFHSLREALTKSSIVSITDVEGKIVFANELFCYYSKYSREELIGKSHAVINSGFHPREFFADLWRTIKSGKTWRGEIKNKAADGSYYWVETVIAPVLNASGEIANFLSIRNIITEKKEIESRLSEYKHALDNSNDHIYLVDPNSMRFTDVNYSGYTDLGYRRSEILEMGPLDIMPDYTVDDFRNILYQLRSSSNNRVIFNTLHQRKDGASFPVEISLSSFISSDQKFHVLMAARDASIRESDRKKQQMNAIETEEKKRALIARDLHDGVSQNLAAVNMMLMSVEEETAEMCPDLKHRLADIKSLLAKSIDDVRKISHDLMPREISAYGICKSVETLVQRLSVSSDIETDLVLNGKEPVLPISIRVNVYRIIDEFINNVLRHSDGKRLTIKISFGRDTLSIQLQDHCSGKYFGSVAGSGISISEMISRMKFLDAEHEYFVRRGEGIFLNLKLNLVEKGPELQENMVYPLI